MDTKNAEGLKLVKDIIKGKLTGQKLRDVIQGKETKVSENEIGSVDVLKADTELQIIDTAPSLDISGAFQSFEASSGSQDELDGAAKLPQIKVQKSLEFLSSKIVASADQEAVDFFIASRRNRIWAEVFEDESAVEAIEAFTDEGYGRQVRDQFLDEYNQARDMAIPSGWAFRVDGKITPPNLMQKLAAVRLRSQQRVLNLSLTGTGKTIAGILSSRIIDAHLTIIICPLDTVPNWHGEIKHVFPDSRVTIKNFNPHWTDVEGGHHYILLNHEMFQQPSAPAHIRQLLERYQVDFIIVDEIHRCKQRGDDPSKRRQMVLALIANAAERNPNLHVLGMSATPVINNLKEGKSLVELVAGVERADLNEKATLNNCMRLHQAFVTLGIRSRVKPKINIKRVTLPVDCTYLVDEIREEGTSILKMEQILTRARIPAILKELHPKTVVYTHYSVIPYEDAIRWLQKRSDLVVADFGCGEALIAKALIGKHTVHNFDFIAINDAVTECDMARVPLEDRCLDVAMFNLSLMGLNVGDYIREASRTLKLDGQLWIYEVTSHIKDLQGFVRGLETAGFRIIENTEVWKFRYIRAIKSEEVALSQIKVQL